MDQNTVLMIAGLIVTALFLVALFSSDAFRK